MPSNSGVVVGSGARPGVSGIRRLVGVKVRVVLEKVVVVVVGLVVERLGGFLVVLLLRVRRRGGPLLLVDGVVGVKDGFVLMVVDHHPADHAARRLSDPLLRACVELRRLRGYYRPAGSRHWVLKALRWGRDHWNGGQRLAKESRGSGGALLGGHVCGLLRRLCRVRVASCRQVLLGPSQSCCTEAPELLRAPLWVTVVIPAPITPHLRGLHRLRTSIGARGRVSSS